LLRLKNSNKRNNDKIWYAIIMEDEIVKTIILKTILNKINNNQKNDEQIWNKINWLIMKSKNKFNFIN